MQRLMDVEITIETLPAGSQVTTVLDEMAGMLTSMLTMASGWRPNAIPGTVRHV